MDELFNKSLAAIKRFFWPIVVGLVTLLAITAAGGTQRLIAAGLEAATPYALPAPPAPKAAAGEVRRRAIEEYATIAERNLFNSKPPSAAPVGEALAEPNQRTVETSLQVRLIATMVIDGAPSWALIQDKANPSYIRAHTLGDSVLDQAEVIEIRTDSVLLDNRGRKETLTLQTEESSATGVAGDGSAAAGGGLPAMAERLRNLRLNDPNAPSDPLAPPGTEAAALPEDDGNIRKVSENTFEIDRQYFDSQMGNLGSLMTQARVVPHMVKNQISGYKIFAIKPGSVYERLGLNNGDILERINGIEVKTPDKAMGMLQDLQRESNFELDVIRKGQKQTLVFQVR